MAWRELGAADELGSPEAPLVDAWFRVLPFVPQSREQLDAARSRLTRWDAGAVTLSTQASAFYSGHNGVHRILKTYLLGLLDARRGDTAGAAARVMELDSVGHDSAGPLALELAQGLEAGITLAKGRPDSALAGLDALHIEGWYELTFLSQSCSGPKATARRLWRGTVAWVRTRRRSWSSSDRRRWPRHASSAHSVARGRLPHCTTHSSLSGARAIPTCGPFWIRPGRSAPSWWRPRPHTLTARYRRRI